MMRRNRPRAFACSGEAEAGLGNDGAVIAAEMLAGSWI
mgnify:CR=1 FL=1|jgi:hypothetical protein